MTFFRRWPTCCCCLACYLPFFSLFTFSRFPLHHFTYAYLENLNLKPPDRLLDPQNTKRRPILCYLKICNFIPLKLSFWPFWQCSSFLYARLPTVRVLFLIYFYFFNYFNRFSRGTEISSHSRRRWKRATWCVT